MNKIFLLLIFAITFSLVFSYQDVAATHNSSHVTSCDDVNIGGGGTDQITNCEVRTKI